MGWASLLMVRLSCGSPVPPAKAHLFNAKFVPFSDVRHSRKSTEEYSLDKVRPVWWSRPVTNIVVDDCSFTVPQCFAQRLKPSYCIHRRSCTAQQMEASWMSSTTWMRLQTMDQSTGRWVWPYISCVHGIPISCRHCSATSSATQPCVSCTSHILTVHYLCDHSGAV